MDPLTREVRVDEKDVKVLKQLIRKADHVVCHNSKFDLRMLEMVGVEVLWRKVHDTHAAAHVLASMEQKDLLSSEWEPSDNGPDRRVYMVTELGREALAQSIADLALARDQLTAALDSVSVESAE